MQAKYIIFGCDSMCKKCSCRIFVPTLNDLYLNGALDMVARVYDFDVSKHPVFLVRNPSFKLPGRCEPTVRERSLERMRSVVLFHLTKRPRLFLFCNMWFLGEKTYFNKETRLDKNVLGNIFDGYTL